MWAPAGSSQPEPQVSFSSPAPSFRRRPLDSLLRRSRRLGRSRAASRPSSRAPAQGGAPRSPVSSSSALPRPCRPPPWPARRQPRAWHPERELETETPPLSPRAPVCARARRWSPQPRRPPPCSRRRARSPRRRRHPPRTGQRTPTPRTPTSAAETRAPAWTGFSGDPPRCLRSPRPCPRDRRSATSPTAATATTRGLLRRPRPPLEG